jgi:Mg2+ and Co2+ transporter CorA
MNMKHFKSKHFKLQLVNNQTRQYQSLVTQLNNSKDPLDESILNSTVQTTLRKLEQKGDQLEMLKQFHRHTMKKLRMSPKKSATYDPKHLRAVKLLHNFQDMSHIPVYT